MFQNSLFLSGRQNFYIAIYIDTHRLNHTYTLSSLRFAPTPSIESKDRKYTNNTSKPFALFMFAQKGAHQHQEVVNVLADLKKKTCAGS